jgi:hypothetical protein
MLRFLSKLIAFSFPIVALLAHVERRLGRWPNTYQTKRAAAYRQIENARVIVTDSSHEYYGVQPRLFGTAGLNLAHVSQDLYYDNRLLLTLLPYARRAELVILFLSDFSLTTTMYDTSESWRTSYYFRYWSIPRVSGSRAPADYSWIVLYGANAARSAFWGGPPETPQAVNEDGSAEMTCEPASVVEDAAPAMTRHAHSARAEHLGTNRRYLAEMFEALKARSIVTVLATTPVHRSYYTRMDPLTYAGMQSQVLMLARRYGLEYHNYFMDPRFNAGDFFDTDHLCGPGARKFSAILREEIVSPHLGVEAPPASAGIRTLSVATDRSSP